MKRDLWEAIIIGECELLVTIISALLWGNGNPRIIIMRTDNYNVFDWLSNRKAKIDTASRLLRALADYLIGRKIGLIPRFVWSGRNFTCDHLSRTEEQGIADWARIMNMQPVEFPETRYALVDSWGPEVEFLI